MINSGIQLTMTINWFQVRNMHLIICSLVHILLLLSEIYVGFEQAQFFFNVVQVVILFGDIHEDLRFLIISINDRRVVYLLPSNWRSDDRRRFSVSLRQLIWRLNTNFGFGYWLEWNTVILWLNSVIHQLSCISA